jgi:hypothetical protein
VYRNVGQLNNHLAAPLEGLKKSSGCKYVTSAAPDAQAKYAAGKVYAASVEGALGRWIYAAKVSPSASDHRSWPTVFAALKTARRQRGRATPLPRPAAVGRADGRADGRP